MSFVILNARKYDPSKCVVVYCYAVEVNIGIYYCNNTNDVFGFNEITLVSMMQSF
jgi:hypothetical protein